MSVTISSITSTVRGLVVDRTDDETTPLFSDTEILSAINSTKDGFFGVRPEAFCVSSILCSPPADSPALPDTVSIVCADDSLFTGDYALAGRRWELDDTHAVWKDTLWYLSDGTTTYTAPDNGLDVPPATFTRTWDHPLTITVSGTGTVVDGAVSGYGGLDQFGKGGWDSSLIDPHPVDLTICFESDTGKWEVGSGTVNELWYNQQDPADGNPPKYGWDAGVNFGTSAPTLEYTLEATATVSSFTIGDTTTTPDEWIEDAELEINPWAVQQFCYGVAAFLLMQRGKDAFYRKAADALQKLYLGR